jgi:HD superfamily phosphohydrolase
MNDNISNIINNVCILEVNGINHIAFNAVVYRDIYNVFEFRQYMYKTVYYDKDVKSLDIRKSCDINKYIGKKLKYGRKYLSFNDLISFTDNKINDLTRIRKHSDDCSYCKMFAEKMVRIPVKSREVSEKDGHPANMVKYC